LKDYYQLLEVENTATQQQIRKAYYKLAHQYHPDKSANPQHHQRFLDINEAYQIIGDKSKREIYHYRWLQYKYPPKPAPATAAPNPQPKQTQTRQTTTRRPNYAPPQYTAHYQNYSANAYREYEKLLRQVCQISLILAGFFLLDLLFTQTLTNETIVELADPVNRSGESYTKVITTNASFWLRYHDLKDLELYPEQVINLRRTPLLRQTLAIQLAGFWTDVNRASLYHNFFVLILLQACLGAAGLYRNFSWPARMNLGILAGIDTALSLIIVFLSY
jgi:hypothetical protein